MKHNPANSKSGFGSIRLDWRRIDLLKVIAEREDRPVASVLRRAVDRELELDDEKQAAFDLSGLSLLDSCGGPDEH